MRYKTTYSTDARLVNHDGTVVASERIAGKLGIACHDDSVLNYTLSSWLAEAT